MISEVKPFVQFVRINSDNVHHIKHEEENSPDRNSEQMTINHNN